MLFITDLVYLALGLLSLSPTRKRRPRLPALLPVPGILPVTAELPAGLVVDSSSGQWARFIPGVPSLTLIKLCQGGIWPAPFVSCAPMPGERHGRCQQGPRQPHFSVGQNSCTSVCCGTPASTDGQGKGNPTARSLQDFTSHGVPDFISPSCSRTAWR